MKFASLCLLAYKRPEMLKTCLQSLHDTLDYPAEIIINFDGLEGYTPEEYKATQEIKAANFSKVIFNNGNNRGVGRSLQNCLGLAEGDYIFKIDTDLIFKTHWLTTAIAILDDNPDIGAVSLFDYLHYNPEEKRFKHLEERNDCIIVDDFVSSIFGFRKKEYIDWEYQTIIPDDGLHQNFGTLAISREDYVENQGFGLGKSTYVVPDATGQPVKAKTFNIPLLFPHG